MNILKNFKFDFSAGFSVALIALPLSIGISLASDAPASAGIMAAIIGGLVGSWLGGSYVAINGPAAGLIVIVVDAVISLGHGDMFQGFKGMLAASVVAGAMQIIFGLLKLGRKGTAFPTSVIHGMMAAIGLIIIAKQIHVLLGYAPVAKNPIMLFGEIPQGLISLNPHIFIVGGISLVFLIMWSKLTWKWTKKLPAPLLATVLGAAIASYFGFAQKDLLQVPSDFSKWIVFPDFSVMSTFAGWKAAITIALVASLETTLCAAAVDKIDPERRKSNLDRDLISKGICNMLSGSIGGLPMISEIVRSSANVSFGAKTAKANFVHGFVVLVLVVLLPSALTLIPLASLAAILIMIGSRLASPSHFLHAKKIGMDNLAGFAITLLLTMSVDLLVGVFVGVSVQFAVEMSLGLKLCHLLKPSYTVSERNNETVIAISSALAFSNFLCLKEELEALAENKKNVRLELTQSEYIDHSVMESLHDLKNSFTRKGCELSIILSEKHSALGDDLLSAKRLTI